MRPSPAGEFSRTVLTFAFLAACAAIFVGAAVLGVRKFQADVRTANAVERIAAAMEYTADPMSGVKRRHATSVELDKIIETADCKSVAFIGYDSLVHPDYCR